jgi:hypothetical protein
MVRTTVVLIVCTLLISTVAFSSEQTKSKSFADLKTQGLTAAPAPDLMGGLVVGYGAFDFSKKPEVMVELDLGFPNGVKFIHDKLTYFGKYTDPQTGIAGYLYHLKGGAYERYFLVSDEGVQGPTDSQRYLVDYDGNGKILRVDRGIFAPRP